jgi:hypothetical protein
MVGWVMNVEQLVEWEHLKVKMVINITEIWCPTENVMSLKCSQSLSIELFSGLADFNVALQVLMAVTVIITLSRNVMPCNMVYHYQHFRGMNNFLPWRWSQYIHPTSVMIFKTIWMNTVHPITCHLFKIHLNIILTSIHGSCEYYTYNAKKNHAWSETCKIFN